MSRLMLLLSLIAAGCWGMTGCTKTSAEPKKAQLDWKNEKTADDWWSKDRETGRTARTSDREYVNERQVDREEDAKDAEQDRPLRDTASDRFEDEPSNRPTTKLRRVHVATAPELPPGTRSTKHRRDVTATSAKKKRHRRGAIAMTSKSNGGKQLALPDRFRGKNIFCGLGNKPRTVGV